MFCNFCLGLWGPAAYLCLLPVTPTIAVNIQVCETMMRGQSLIWESLGPLPQRQAAGPGCRRVPASCSLDSHSWATAAIPGEDLSCMWWQGGGSVLPDSLTTHHPMAPQSPGLGQWTFPFEIVLTLQQAEDMVSAWAARQGALCVSKGTCF